VTLKTESLFDDDDPTWIDHDSEKVVKKDPTYVLHHGDCLEVMKTMDDDTFTACVTDPPAELATLDRFLDKVNKTGSIQGCWIWTGSHNGVGYGEIRIKNKKVYAHRWAYENIGGNKIPEGYQIDHLCRNPSCVNPDHLEAVLPKTNVQRGLGALPRPQSKHKYCTQGHLLDETEYIRPDGRGRNCSECVRTRAREYARRKYGWKAKI